MSPRRGRIYWRETGNARRAYADFRDYADVGGGREALVPTGQKLATDDSTIAEVLVGRRLEDLEARRRARVLQGTARSTSLQPFVREHLIAKKKSGRFTDRWLEFVEKLLARAIARFGAERELSSIGVADVRAWSEALQGTGLAGGTVRHHLNAVSNLYRRAQAEGCVVPGYNPVGALLEKPSARREEARWFEVPEASLLLEAARTYRPRRKDLAVPFAYQLVATLLLTGGRRAEVLGLEVDDVSFDRKTITFRPNQWRRLKTSTSFRSVRLWPQLEEILRAYVFGADAPPGRLLFPCYRTGEEAMLGDARKLLDAIGARVGFNAGELGTKMFRHTYCAARLQTLDQGAPVSTYTVAKELGHGGEAMVRRVYGHLGQVRHRSDVVEYRVEQHAAALKDRLAQLLAQPDRPSASTH
jgi:integrase